MGLFLIWLLVSKKKGKESSQPVNENPEPLKAVYENPEAVYEDPDAALNANVLVNFSQDKEVITADNMAYSTQLQVLQDKGVKTQDNLAYGVVSTVF